MMRIERMEVSRGIPYNLREINRNLRLSKGMLAVLSFTNHHCVHMLHLIIATEQLRRILTRIIVLEPG
jgi:hypothetical protein